MNEQRENASGSCEHCGLPVPRSRLRRGGAAAAFCCMGCRLVHQIARAGEDDADGQPTNPLLLRLGLGIFLTMNIMAFSGFFYSNQVYGAPGQVTAAGSMLASLFSYLLLLLCTLVILLLGGPLIGEALSTAQRGDSDSPRGRWSLRIDVNLLILVGVIAAYGLSAVSTLRGHGHLYYDTAAMILLLVTLGGYLDARAKRRAAASGASLLASLPARVFRRVGADVIEVDAAAIEPGDEVRFRPGETIAIDGFVAGGASHVDESTLTGESRLRPIAAGARVLAGSMNLDGLLWVRASAAPGDRVIDQVKRMLDEARRRQPTIQRLADGVAAVFVPLVAALALGVFAWHAWRGNPGEGLFTALSVLLISCPCALGLAAPLACYTALTRAARRGILIDSPATLEKLAAVAAVIFDKTGTLTRGRMTVDCIAAAAGVTIDDALSLAAAIESATNHPIAQAILAHAAARGLVPADVQGARLLPGLGIEGTIDQRRLRLGNESLARQCGCDGDPLLATSEAGTDVFLIEESRVLARFTLADEARPEAPGVLAMLRARGMTTTVLTGDQPGPARRLAEELNIAFVAGLLPADKVAHLQRLRSESGRRVAFVGDGVNDAPAMGAADVGIAVGNATDLARQAGHVHLIGEGLERLPLVFQIARQAVRRVRFNLLWAFGYNAIGLTLATLGVLTPIFAASSMVVSSLLIVVTSSRSDGSTSDVAASPQPARNDSIAPASPALIPASA